MALARVEVVPNVADAAKAHLLAIGRRAIATKGRFNLALSGGSTPRALYQLLNADDLPWAQVAMFFGDERRVPLDHPLSNFRMVQEALGDRLPGITLHPLQDAAAYDVLLRQELGPEGRFDLILLGLGEDGHTASLFPGSPALHETRRWVVDAPGVAPAPERITLTPPVLQQAHETAVLVSGAGKAPMLAEVLNGPPDRYPIQLLNSAQGHVLWLADPTAAAAL